MSFPRERRPADLDACVAALHAVHRADAYPAAWPDDPAGWLTPSGLAGAWVAAGEEGDVVGHAGLVRSAEADPDVLAAFGTASPGDLGWVARLFVAPAGRGRGLAAALLDRVRSEAEARGLRPVLDVEDGGRAAVALYERAGWKRVYSKRAEWIAPNGLPALVHYYVG